MGRNYAGKNSRVLHWECPNVQVGCGLPVLLYAQVESWQGDSSLLKSSSPLPSIRNAIWDFISFFNNSLSSFGELVMWLLGEEGEIAISHMHQLFYFRCTNNCLALSVYCKLLLHIGRGSLGLTGLSTAKLISQQLATAAAPWHYCPTAPGTAWHVARPMPQCTFSSVSCPAPPPCAPAPPQPPPYYFLPLLMLPSFLIGLFIF